MKRKLDPTLVSSYDYELPSSAIAKYPANPPDSAKLLVYERETQKITHAIFHDLPQFLPKDVALVFNDTKVIKARIFGKKESGGKIELLLNRPVADKRFSVFIKGRVKKGTKLFFDEGLKGEVIELLPDGSRVVAFYKDSKELTFEELLPILENIGHIPLPPYIDRADTKEDEIFYQPLFAQKPGAVAAPTASLHFTKELLAKLQKEHPFFSVTLHVGAGTFKPVESEKITEHSMHSEYYEIPSATCAMLDSKQPILAVGTTVTRTIEYYARTKRCFGECDLFLHPKNPPIRVNHLLTNFHLPKSTLIMLVASFIGLEKTLELYEIAIKEKYRFFSYGDAMLII
ncbi:S-adenosylmethionine:tRNA ribosyltransferase-isomerase [Nitratiruptor sp. YY08-26]|uniref:tRNA preQ1(34) S-adenosylmethionine ribosyltransferase-isomerase QueA n=1 Tax=unclassified Nitratiruptor TaxID=2624044 RepID=UPI00191558FC|nr:MULTISPECIES: tRNA preQ1(34) S-adenosylmethionine ribosyltransferase-isomerase QueA [unclassified Nitratiruptor]BCD61962.1 S-adenosylmethionine:tRNA ribosyltransferase-isomerase [Nitratiruptor sp. YY08-13]BCD65897.1 S-adenosylmethionine:tRNA ribosyltransferase-isomerase [Nitratiruptor sp. YY08-26]